MKQKNLFSTDDYLRIHNNVLLFKETNDEKYATEVLQSFYPFIQKYINLICYGNYKVSDSSSMNFISLYAQSKKASATIKNANKIKKSFDLLFNTVEMIRDTCASLTEEDIEHYIYLTLINMMKNYKDTKPSFHTYVLRTFHFNFYRQIDKHMRNPLSKTFLSNSTDVSKDDENSSFCINIEDQNALCSIEEVEDRISLEQMSKIKDTTKNYNLDKYDNDFFDINWINGYTCSEIFSTLTPMERRIMYLWCVEKKTDGEIADMFGLYRGTINVKRAKAKKKLEDLLKSKHMLK